LCTSLFAANHNHFLAHDLWFNIETRLFQSQTNLTSSLGMVFKLLKEKVLAEYGKMVRILTNHWVGVGSQRSGKLRWWDKSSGTSRGKDFLEENSLPLRSEYKGWAIGFVRCSSSKNINNL
jgi:hypothetical protein